jgi:hypothetical protein
VRRLVLASLVLSGCSWGLSGYSNPTDAPAAGDAGETDAGTSAEASPEASVDSGVLGSGASCAAIKNANPNAPDGPYRIADSFDAYCDMHNDSGGWMLVTEAMITEETKQSVTVVHDKDTSGRLLIRIFANSDGCSDAIPRDVYGAWLPDTVKWTQLRARYEFYGWSDCWDILGAEAQPGGIPTNIAEFTPGVDTARDAVRMGGKTGDAFPGVAHHCDQDPANFWTSATGNARRSMLAIVRRNSPDTRAAIGTVTSCTNSGPGNMSPTYWEYREIFIR